MTAADCGPEPPSRAFLRIASDSAIIGTITGQVFDANADNGLPTRLGAAVVTVVGTNRGTNTDSLGRFRIDSVEPGRYAIRTRRLGFKPRQDSIVLTELFGQAVDIGVVRRVLDGCPGFMAVVSRKRKWVWP